MTEIKEKRSEMLKEILKEESEAQRTRPYDIVESAGLDRFLGRHDPPRYLLEDMYINAAGNKETLLRLLDAIYMADCVHMDCRTADNEAVLDFIINAAEDERTVIIIAEEDKEEKVKVQESWKSIAGIVSKSMWREYPFYCLHCEKREKLAKKEKSDENLETRLREETESLKLHVRAIIGALKYAAYFGDNKHYNELYEKLYVKDSLNILENLELCELAMEIYPVEQESIEVKELLQFFSYEWFTFYSVPETYYILEYLVKHMKMDQKKRRELRKAINWASESWLRF